ncbi:MAG TPA: response regulator transcription factor [Anaerolineales bacterium]|nr:response regulator transcription factor [Anaerolineales bacterium]
MQKDALQNVQNQITVLLADDHPTTRTGIRTILHETPDIRVVGESENGFQVQEMAAELRPNILLLDLVMPGPTPAELEKWVRSNFPETVTLVLTAHDRDVYLTTMMDAGAAGFLSKTETGESLILAIRRAAGGSSLYTEEQFQRAMRWRQEAGNKIKELTRRELQILQFISDGKDNKQISLKLEIATKTTAYHITNILSKLGVNSRHEASAWAHKHLPDNPE